MKTYECKTCGCAEQDKFYPHNKSTCKICIGNRSKKHYRENKELISKRNKEKYKEQKEQKIEVAKTYYSENILKARLLTARKRAEKKNLPFTLTMDHIAALILKQEGRCAYTNRKLTLTVNDLDCISIDRIDSSLGYTVDNVQLVVSIVNSMKLNMTEELFFTYVKDIHKHNKLE